jgi:hypothetical protein
MPGCHINDHQIRLYTKLGTRNSPAAISVASTSRVRIDRRPPFQQRPPRGQRQTRSTGHVPFTIASVVLHSVWNLSGCWHG